ncbi:MAG: hypothetical protein IPM27_01450 [Nitrosomonadales bacterium]|nr:hypothetical protein [Nitrosomonadales bacterium]
MTINYAPLLTPLAGKHIVIAWLFAALLGVPLTGCTQETIGQQFRNILAQIDAQCRKDKMGPYLDKNDPGYKSKRARTDCDILKIKPADPLATEEGRFAYSIKLPEPHGTVKTEYRKGMSAESYFKELCGKDAGEWVFKTVEGVEGVFQGRNLNTEAPSAGYSDLIISYKEAGYISTKDMQDSLVQPYHGRYNYMERPRDWNETGKPYVRFFRGAEALEHYKVGTQKNKMPVYVPYVVNKEQTDMLKSRYAFTWRQVLGNDATENGIAGSELIIFDRTTNEVLAFKRSFVRVWPRPDSRQLRLTNRAVCNPGSYPTSFVQQVLVPINPAE